MWHLTKLSEAEQLKKAFAVKILAGSAKNFQANPFSISKACSHCFFPLTSSVGYLGRYQPAISR